MVKYSSGLEIFGVIQGYTLTLDWKDIVYNATSSEFLRHFYKPNEYNAFPSDYVCRF